MTNKEKAFVILTPGFASSEEDTSCLPMQQEFVRTISLFYPHLQIIILSFQYPYHEKTYKWYDTTVVSFNGMNKGGIQRLLLRQKVKRVLNKLHRQKQITGLLSFWLNECAAVGKKFGEKNKIPHYCWLLGQDAREQNKYPKRLQVQPHELIALSDFLQEEFERNHRIRPIHIVTPGIPKRQIVETIRDIDLLAVGSLIPLKQFEVFIEIVASLKKKLPSINAKLIGEGPEKERLQKLIEEADIKENISLTGMMSHDEVLHQMQRSKILIHPSLYEGYSGVCVEALSSGTCVISFCRAMKSDIENWHIVETKAEMIEKSLTILCKGSVLYQPVVVQSMNETVKKMMDLYQEA